ncbi:hypothetical protein D7X88_01665 [bacterium C-53]|mgnify:FL=1|nr:hypothetical protein [Lachnospiraceae bacterium]NBI01728.1 hypothetical protein [Lachnospiraceae bacterium]RKJ13014.1 hypothetical protein D7X88_01665 [bacterium C-53]
MSGPKYSEAELKRIEKERLQAERQRKLEEMRKVLEESKEKLRKEYADLYDIKSEIKNLKAQISETDDVYSTTQIHKLDEIISTVKVDMSGSRKEIENRITYVRDSVEDARKQVEAILYKYKENMYVKHIKASVCEQEKELGNICMSQQQSFEKYYGLLDECDCLYDISSEDKGVITNIAARLISLLKCKEDILEIEKIYEILKNKVHNSVKKQNMKWDLYDDYVIKAETMKEKIRGMEEFQSLTMLRREIDRLNSDIRENDKLEYISKVIEEVMSEYGHEVLRSDVMRNASDLYKNSYFKFDPDSVINVKQSSNGAIVMEIAITGEDETPDEYEREKSVGKMISFCSQYPELVNRLKEKGVQYNQIKNMPPDKCFAKKVDRKKLNNMNRKSRTKNYGKIYKNM